MLRQVVVGARVYALHLFKTKGHMEFYVSGSVGIVSKLLVVVEAIVLFAHS